MARKSKSQAKLVTEPPPSKLESISQLDGRSTEKNKPIPRTLDELWGDTGAAKYKTVDIDKYELSLKEMTKSDLQDHAIKVGLVPIDDSVRLKRNLVAEFVRHRNKYAKMPVPNSSVKEVSPEVRRIMSEGR